MDDFEIVGEGPRTRSAWVEGALRDAILDGSLAPGVRLNITTLSERLQVSPTPLREALQRLAGYGLISLSPQRGAFVSELSSDDLFGIYELRTLLETEAAEQSIENLDAVGRDRITNAHSALTIAYSAPDSDRKVRESAHRDFHTSIVANCKSPRMLRIVEELLDHAARYRLVSTEFEVVGHMSSPSTQPSLKLRSPATPRGPASWSACTYAQHSRLR